MSKPDGLSDDELLDGRGLAVVVRYLRNASRVLRVPLTSTPQQLACLAQARRWIASALGAADALQRALEARDPEPPTVPPDSLDIPLEEVDLVPALDEP